MRVVRRELIRAFMGIIMLCLLFSNRLVQAAYPSPGFNIPLLIFILVISIFALLAIVLLIWTMKKTNRLNALKNKTLNNK